MVDFADVDILAANYHQRGGQPAVAYGIVTDGELAHAGGLGERYLGGPPPDAATVFRIASMTKSFTASVIVSLRDDGALDLDDTAETYVPELHGWTPDGSGWAPVTIRHLLTMTAGFPTDDPWGDRQQGLPLDEFGRFLAAGVSVNWAPGTRFEYSNLGYAILGRIITVVTSAAYPDYVRDRLLRPLGMDRTGYEAGPFEDGAAEGGGGPGGLARGYRRSPQGWSEVPYDPCGAFAPMGGVFSCVRDLARWVAGFAAAFPPGASDPLRPHPVRAASRRQMQLPQVLTGWNIRPAFPGDPAFRFPATYGFGLFVDEHPTLGRVVSHSGGYPGFGSNMCWHPASGTGAIALGNGTYAAMSALTARLLEAVVRQQEAPAWGYGLGLAPAGDRHPGPWPETLAARDAVSDLLRSWDDAAATRLFSPNVAQDAPFGERQQRIARIRELIGDFGDDPAREPEFDTPAHCRWWLTGPDGTVQAQIQLNPERPPRVQSLTLAVPPAPGSMLHDTLGAVLAWMDGSDLDWPAAIPVAGLVDAALLARRLRMAAVWAGPCRPGAWTAGDGVASTTVELTGPFARITLTLVIDPDSGLLQSADVTPDP